MMISEGGIFLSASSLNNIYMEIKKSLITKLKNRNIHTAALSAVKFIFDSRNALGKLGKDSPKVERL